MEDCLLFHLHADDNVAVALADLASDTVLDNQLTVNGRDVPRGHKIVTRPVKPGGSVIKYGHIIGHATADIRPGDHVHLHNLGMSDHSTDYAHSSSASPTAMVAEEERDTFMGYRREDGKTGTRNYVGIISSVNCSATVANHIVREVDKHGLLEGFPNVDGVVAITHGVGCCISSANEGFRMLQRTIWGHVRHPNFGGVLMVGLGCETNQIPGMIEVASGQQTKSEAQGYGDCEFVPWNISAQM